MKGEVLELKKIDEKIMLELEHFRKTGIPRCYYCHKDFVHASDSMTKKKSKYSWKPNCSCVKKGLIISKG